MTAAETSTSTPPAERSISPPVSLITAAIPTRRFTGYINGVLSGTDSDYYTSSGSGITFTKSSGWTSVADSNAYSCNSFSISSANPSHWNVGFNTALRGGVIILSREYDDTALTGEITISSFSGTVSGETLSAIGLTAGQWYMAAWTNSSGETDYVMIATYAYSVPEPASAGVLFGIGVLGTVVFRRKPQGGHVNA